MRQKVQVSIAVVVLVVASAAVGLAGSGLDFGVFVQNQLHNRSETLFGISGALESSSPVSISPERASRDPRSLARVARSLRVRVVTSGKAAPNIDQMALWPNDRHPKWLLACNEEDATQPALQRIRIATGVAHTMLTGTESCDGVRRTPWHTFMFSEEGGEGSAGGRVYELIDPIQTTGVHLNRKTGRFSGGTGAQNFAVRPSLGRLSFEGFAIYSNGVAYYGDEKRPFEGGPGGSYFKFIPTVPYATSHGPISSLDASPFQSGSIFGLRLGVYEEPDYGQGTQQGLGTWVPVCSKGHCVDADLSALAIERSLTGYYRPEDIDIDRRAQIKGRVRFCGNNTGNEDGDRYYGETICVRDGGLAEATSNTARPELQLAKLGGPELNMPDNIAYQPGRGHWILHEDGATEYLRPHNNDLWDCLGDGRDDDLLSDGCVRVATLRDLTAEWTGGIFDSSGKRFFVSVQHNISGAGVILEITGWK